MCFNFNILQETSFYTYLQNDWRWYCIEFVVWSWVQIWECSLHLARNFIYEYFLRKCVRFWFLWINICGHPADMGAIFWLWLTLQFQKLKCKVISLKSKLLKCKSSTNVSSLLARNLFFCCEVNLVSYKLLTALTALIKKESFIINFSQINILILKKYKCRKYIEIHEVLVLNFSGCPRFDLISCHNECFVA